jgi:predicted metal-dependent hydrolase
MHTYLDLAYSSSQKLDTALLVSFVDGEFLVDIANQMIDEDARSQIKQLYDEWIMRSAYPILKNKVETYSQKLGLEIKKILVKKNLKSRCASLT